MNDIAEQTIKQHEGFSSFVYDCPAGFKTIGYGRNLEASGVGISEQEAAYLLGNDIERLENGLAQRFPWFSALGKVRQAALIDMAYNLGLGGLAKFKNMVAAMAVCDYETAAAEMLDSRWAAQVGGRAKRLSEMIRTGEV